MQKRQLPNGKWQFTEGFKDKNGKYRRITVIKPNKTRASEKEAYEELQEKIKEKLEDKVELKTIGYYKNEFLEIKKNSVSINTLTSYKTILKLLDDNINISNITKVEYEKKLIEYREMYSPGHVKLIKTIFNIFFKFIKTYYAPTFNINLEFTLSKEDKFKEKQKIKYIETNKIQDVLESITHPLTKDFMTVQLLTGLRAGELLAITPKDIDIKNKTLSVNKTKHTSGIFTSPKTLSSVRIIEIDDRTLNILMRYISASETLFNTNISTLNYNLKKVKLSTHMFRHTHVALLVEAGVPIKVISERLGHSKIDTTLDIYTHVTENMKLDLRTKLNNLCADITQKIKNKPVRCLFNRLFVIMHSNDLVVSKSSLYRYVNNRYFSIDSVDCKRIVKFRKRNKVNKEAIPKHLKSGRAYTNFLDFMNESAMPFHLEMDTVIGKRGGKTLLTFNVSSCNFMFALLLDSNTSSEVSSKLYNLKEKFYQNNVHFSDVFPVILTDNGSEFSKVEEIEYDFDKNLKLFFCNPNSSWEKGKIEKNHTTLREILPKGSSFDDLTQSDINIIISHINSLKRKYLNGKSAYEVFSFTFGEHIANLLGIFEIPANEVILKPSLVKQIKEANK